MARQLESVIKKSILAYLHANGVFSFIYVSAGMYDPRVKVWKKMHSSLSPAGIPDILGIFTYKNIKGRFLAIEVKTSTGVVSPHQKAMIDRINALGGIAFVARSIDEVQYNLREIMKNAEHE